nr:uncharacterized mitochondrial protein AtMg00810-like [Tanacetum cinerariifolium]
MDQPNPTFAKILILDTGKFEQWKFRIQQYLQNEHYALWEVIEFGDSNKAPLEESDKGPASESSVNKKGRTVAITTEDMQKRRNDTFGENEATKKTKKNPLKQQYGNFKAEGSETLDQTFNKLQAIVSHLEIMDVEIEEDDLNQKFLTSLAPEWLMYTIVWRNRDDLDTMSLDDVYNHLKVYEPRIKYKDITQIDKDDIEEMDIKWNMALLSMRADRFWKKTGKKITIQGSDVEGPNEEEPAPKALMAIDGIGWDWSYMANEEENHAGVADDEARLVEFKEQEIKFCEKIRGLERDVEVRNNKIEYLMNELEHVKKEKKGLDNKLTGFEKASKDLDNLLGSQRSDKNKEALGYTAVPPPLHKPTPSIDASKSNPSDLQSDNFSVSKHEESSGSIMSKPMIKFVKAADCPRVNKTNDTENARKSTIKYAEMYRNTTKSLKVREKGEFWPKNNYAHKNVTPKAVLLKTGRTPVAINRPNMNVAQPKMKSFAKTAHSNVKRPFQGESAVRTQPRVPRGNSQNNIDDKGYWDSGCSRHMTGNLSYLSEYEPYDGGYVSFGQGGGKITGKGIIKTDTQDVASQAVKKDVSSLRYIALPNCNGISNPTATLKVPSAEQVEPAISLTVETKIPTFSSPVPTICLDISPESSSYPRIISKGDFSQKETLSLGNALTLSNRFKDTFGVEADLSNMETSIPMYVKSAFLYSTIDEEVYVMQPPGFQDPEFPNRVYKVEKAMYGLHQSPRAWYGTLSKYLLDNGFQRGTIDQTLFIREHKGEFLLVQVYVDDIIFGSSNPQLCREFEALMHEKFQMSTMGELTFFLGLQVLQKKDGIFLSQDKYVGDILKKFGHSDVRSANTPMDTHKTLETLENSLYCLK